ncbi:MAG TPA: hypothetical protein V6C58_06310 [Allocoleopsis sp.]
MSEEYVSELPTNFYNVINTLSNYRKSNLRIVPSQPSSSGTVRAGGFIRLSIPSGSIVDLRTLQLQFRGITTINDVSTSTTKLCGFPRDMASLFQDVEIYIGGKPVQIIQNYNLIYKTLMNYRSNPYAKSKRINANTDPSYAQTLSDAGVYTYYPTYKNTPNASINHFDNYYCVDTFIGILGESMPSIWDTSLCGAIDINIRLAPSTVLYCSSSIAGGDTVNYTLSEVTAYIQKIDFKEPMYQNTMASQLRAGGIAVSFKNYQMYTGSYIDGTQAKSNTLRITENTASLDKIYFSFQDQTATGGKQPLVLGSQTDGAGGNLLPSITVDATSSATIKTSVETYVNTNLVANPRVSSFNYTYMNLLALEYPDLLNDSVYFRNNGLGLGKSGTVQFFLNSQEVTAPMNLSEQFECTLQAFDIHDKETHMINPSIRSLEDYEKLFYVCGLSLDHIGDKSSKYSTLVSGVDTQSGSLNLAVKFTAGRSANVAQASLPYIICEMTSQLLITGERNTAVIR